MIFGPREEKKRYFRLFFAVFEKCPPFPRVKKNCPPVSTGQSSNGGGGKCPTGRLWRRPYSSSGLGYGSLGYGSLGYGSLGYGMSVTHNGERVLDGRLVEGVGRAAVHEHGHVQQLAVAWRGAREFGTAHFVLDARARHTRAAGGRRRAAARRLSRRRP